MATPKLTVYIDTVSPFAYIAWHVVQNDPVFKAVDVDYVPIFLGGVMKACGNTPPINIKNKKEWINKERTRWASLFNVPIIKETPEGFPPLTLTIMRAVCAITHLHPRKAGEPILIRALDALLTAFWIDGKKTHEKPVLTEVLKNVLGEEEAAKVMEIAGKEGKEILVKNTDRALADGAFGLPWFVATNSNGETETFWGVDHLGQVTAHLGLEKPNTGAWRALL